MKKLVINFSNKTFYTLVTICVLVFGGFAVYAYGTSSPLVLGHSVGELDLSPIIISGENVGIGMSPSEKLQVNGNVLATAFYYSSDERLKENIIQINNAVEIIENLEGVSFNWKEGGEKSIGLIAQNVEKVLPELVLTDNDGYKSIQYANLVAVLIEAVKEQQKEIDELKNQLNN